MILFSVVLGIIAIAVAFSIWRTDDDSVSQDIRQIPPEMEKHRDALYRECLIAAQNERFFHDHLTYRLKDADESDFHSLTLTDETWPFGIQPYMPVRWDDGFAFTREQSEELRKLLAPLRTGLQGNKAKNFQKAIRQLNGDEE